MSNEVVIREEKTAAVVEVNRQEVLAKVVDAVRQDSRQSAAAFLAETTVPHGGE